MFRGDGWTLGPSTDQCAMLTLHRLAIMTALPLPMGTVFGPHRHGRIRGAPLDALNGMTVPMLPLPAMVVSSTESTLTRG